MPKIETNKYAKSGFLGDPLWLQPSVAGTKDLWRSVIVVHGILAICFGMLLDGGLVSKPGALYCTTAILYFCCRFALAFVRGYPILSRRQALACFLLPFYGPAVFFAIFYLVQHLRFGG